MAGHVCWSYDDRRDLDAYARSYLGSGLDQGEQVWYVPGDQPGPVAEWLLGRGRESRPDAVRVLPIGAAYPTGQVTDPAGQVAAYASATEQAVAAGFTGLRVFADPTPLLRTPAQQ